MRSAWKILLIYTFFVIIWGAFVRASGSGDGCGAHWPSCEGSYLLENPSIEKSIEYIHRATSGLYGIFVFILVALSLLSKKTSQACKSFALGVLFFTIFEALIGAKLVLSELVGDNASLSRALVMVVHLINTLVLLACNVGAIYFYEKHSFLQSKKINYKKWLPVFFLFALTASAGGLAALGDTLYPSESLLEGFAMDFNTNSPLLIKLRSFHPFLAFLLTLIVILRTNPKKAFGLPLVAISLSALVIGLINLILMAPLYLQLIHLFAALAFWVLTLLYFFSENSGPERVS